MSQERPCPATVTVRLPPIPPRPTRTRSGGPCRVPGSVSGTDRHATRTDAKAGPRRGGCNAKRASDMTRDSLCQAHIGTNGMAHVSCGRDYSGKSPACRSCRPITARGKGSIRSAGQPWRCHLRAGKALKQGLSCAREPAQVVETPAFLGDSCGSTLPGVDFTLSGSRAGVGYPRTFLRESAHA